MGKKVNYSPVIAYGGEGWYVEIWHPYPRNFAFVLGITKIDADGDERTQIYETKGYGTLMSCKRGFLGRLGLLKGEAVAARAKSEIWAIELTEFPSLPVVPIGQ